MQKVRTGIVVGNQGQRPVDAKPRKAQKKPAMTVGKALGLTCAAGVIGLGVRHAITPKPVAAEIAPTPSVVRIMRDVATPRIMAQTYDVKSGEMVWSTPQNVDKVNGTTSTKIVVAATKDDQILVARFDSKGGDRYFMSDKAGNVTMSDKPASSFNLSADNIIGIGVMSQANNVLGTDLATGVFQPGEVPSQIAGVKVEPLKDGSVRLNFAAASVRIARDAQVFFKPVAPGARGNTVQLVPPGQ